MEWLGLVCIGLILCYSSYPERTRRLESKFKKLKKGEGSCEMSKIISDLTGKKCLIESDQIEPLLMSAKITADILEVDEEWVKLRFKDKKGGIKTKIIRIDTIKSIELSE